MKKVVANDMPTTGY